MEQGVQDVQLGVRVALVVALFPLQRILAVLEPGPLSFHFQPLGLPLLALLALLQLMFPLLVVLGQLGFLLMLKSLGLEPAGLHLLLQQRPPSLQQQLVLVIV